jgi:hypothetical protein
MNLRVHAALLLLSAPPCCGHAAVIFATPQPGGPLGYTGFNICAEQSIGARFAAPAPALLESLSLWLMTNDTQGNLPQVVQVSLRTDEDPQGPADSAPSSQVLEAWTRTISATGRTPVLEVFPSHLRPQLHATSRYWVVVESTLPRNQDPVWAWSSWGTEFTAGNDGPGTPWESSWGIPVAMSVEAEPPCGTADFDSDGDAATDADIEAFFACLGGACCPSCWGADFNSDGDSATDADIESFFRVLAGSAC